MLRIIISPAKKMRIRTDEVPWRELPAFLDRAGILQGYLQSLSFEKLQNLLSCNRQIAQLNYDRYQSMNLKGNLTPALLSYEGIQYQYMAPGVFTEGQWDYVQEHLRILSGFYGILKPLDGVTPYRLEMQAKLSDASWNNLYEFWGDDIYRKLTEKVHLVVNLASKEYSRSVERYLKDDIQYVTCVFGELTDGRVKTKGTLAKMARGEMVRWMANEGVSSREELEQFRGLGYCFAPDYSHGNTLTFLLQRPEGI